MTKAITILISALIVALLALMKIIGIILWEMAKLSVKLGLWLLWACTIMPFQLIAIILWGKTQKKNHRHH